MMNSFHDAYLRRSQFLTLLLLNQYAEMFFGHSGSLDDDNPSGRESPMLYIIQTIEKYLAMFKKM